MSPDPVPAESVRKRKCSECGRPLTLKPNPTLDIQRPARSLEFYANVVIITLAVWVAFTTVIVAWGCK